MWTILRKLRPLARELSDPLTDATIAASQRNPRKGNLILFGVPLLLFLGFVLIALLLVAGFSVLRHLVIRP